MFIIPLAIEQCMEDIEFIKAELKEHIQAQLPPPLIVFYVNYSLEEEKRFSIEITMFGPKEEIITIMAIRIPFDEEFYNIHQIFAQEKTLILVDKRRPKDESLAMKIGENLKSLTGQEFKIQWVEFVQRLLEE